MVTTEIDNPYEYGLDKTKCSLPAARHDAAKIQPYGYDRFDNVITGLEFERLADPHGPTGGKLLRPSDGKEAKNIA